MKKSRAVPLLMIGTLALVTGCSQVDDDDDSIAVEVKQNQYASREDCVKDWGPDDRNCQPHASGGGVYMGPRYYWNHTAGYPMAIGPGGETRALPNSYLSKPGTMSAARGATTSTVVSRGGFGGTARGMSVGG